MRSYSTRLYLLLLAMLLVVPVLILAGYMTKRFLDSETQRFEEQATNTARLGALATAREVRNLITIAEVLSGNQALQQDDVTAFHLRVKPIADKQNLNIALRTRESKQIVNTAIPLGQPLPNRSSLVAYDQEVLRTGRPAVSDFFVGIADKVPSFAVVVPVRRNGEVAYLLSVSTSTAKLREALRNAVPMGARAAVVDRKGVVITRTADPENTGTSALPDFLQAAARKDAFWRGTNQDGEETLTAIRHADFGWIVSGGGPTSRLLSLQDKTLTAALLGGLSLALIGLAGALTMARMINMPLQSLTRFAAAMDGGNPPSFRPTTNREVNAVGEVLSASLLTLREAAQRQSYLLALSDAMRPLRDPIAIQDTAIRVLGQYLRANRVGYAEDDGDGKTSRVTRNYLDGAESVEGVFSYRDYGEGLWQELQAGKTSVRNDIAALPNLSETERTSYASLGLAATINKPLVKDGKLSSVLFVHQTTPRIWTELEVALVEETAERTFAAVEQARAEAELQKSEDRYENLFNNIDEGFCIIEMIFDSEGKAQDYRFIEANKAFAEQTGLVDSIGKTARHLVPGLEQWWFDTYGEVALSGQSRRFEHGSAAMGRWFEVFASRIGDAAKHQVAIVFNDRSDYRKADLALKAANAKLDAIFETAPIGLAMLGRDLRFTHVNQRLAEINGLPVEAHMGKRPDELLPDITDVSAIMERWKEIIETGQPWLDVIVTGETPARPGVLRSWSENFFPIRVDDSIEGLGAVVFETTEQKAAQEELRQNEERLRLITDAMPQLIAAIDRNGRYLFNNKAYEDWFGLKRDELVGRGVRDVLGSDAFDVTRPHFEKAVKGETVSFAAVLPYRHGGSRHVEVLYVPALASDNRLIGVYAFTTDVTQRKLAEEGRMLLIHELNHRVKNTLATVQSIASQTLRAGDVPRAVQQTLEARLFSLARVHDALTEENWKGADLTDIVQRALAPFRAHKGRFALHGLDVSLEPKTALAIAMVLHELVTNAIKYGALSNEKGHVSLKWSKLRGVLTLRWIESGGPAVMPPEKRGFGSRLIERGLTHELGGTAKISYFKSGLRCNFTIPLKTRINSPVILDAEV
jgi:PAS domain S-box-containing protein